MVLRWWQVYDLLACLIIGATVIGCPYFPWVWALCLLYVHLFKRLLDVLCHVCPILGSLLLGV